MIRDPYIILVGVGGTGSILRDDLGTLFGKSGDYGNLYKKIILIDGDLVERGNISRQNYMFRDIARNKAEVSMEILQKKYEVAAVEAYPNFLTTRLLQRILKDLHGENLILISCVDNHQSRNRIYECLKPNISDTKPSYKYSFRKKSIYPSFLFMDSGNDTHTGWTSALLWDNDKWQGTDMRLRDTALRVNANNDAPQIGGTCAYSPNPQTRFANAKNANLISSQLVSFLKYGKLFGCIAWEDPDFTEDTWKDNEPMSNRIDPITYKQ